MTTTPDPEAVPDLRRVLIAAYDVSRTTSEGRVAIGLLERLSPGLRIVLITRRNNAAALRRDDRFRRDCPTVRVIGFDLPPWAAWWKKGARFYGAYAYLWQLWWPLALRARRRGPGRVQVVHVLNFHNDSLPSFAWRLGVPTVWGPINHHEIVEPWRRSGWPGGIDRRHRLKHLARRFQWRFDPLLRQTVRRMGVILSAGPWVDARLRLAGRPGVVHRSQLGIDDEAPAGLPEPEPGGNALRLICAGRLDWIKGVDLAVEAMALLPPHAQLTVVGDGPARGPLRALAQARGVADRVAFQAALPQDALFAEFRRHDLKLFPSAEVAGLVWIEALGCGLPVVAFRGLTEVAAAADHLPGITLAEAGPDRARSVDALAQAVLAATARPADRTAVACAARRHYGWSSLAAEILATYRRVAEAAW